MKILVLNPGSSSIKFSVFAAAEGGAGGDPKSLVEGEVSGIGGGQAALTLCTEAGADLAGTLGAVAAGTMHEAIALVERALEAADLRRPEAVGYRVVHPGPKLKGHQRITPEVLDDLRGVAAFAPLHDPAAIEMIVEMMRRMPDAMHVACFDTVFHESMPEEATVYALPAEVRAEGVRRYGFHGLSCESVVWEMRDALGDAAARKLVIAHLGSGCSVTACVNGRSVDTSMGLTPTGGVVMGTRPGDLDPGLVLYLLRRAGATVESVEGMLNHDSGLKALGGVNDMRELRARILRRDQAARLAVSVFCRSVARVIAGMVALHGADAVVFTGGIGEHDAATRGEVAGALAGLGMALEGAANAAGLGGQRLQAIGAVGARIAAYVALADEDRMIARHVAAMVAST